MTLWVFWVLHGENNVIATIVILRPSTDVWQSTSLFSMYVHACVKCFLSICKNRDIPAVLLLFARMVFVFSYVCSSVRFCIVSNSYGKQRYTHIFVAMPKKKQTAVPPFAVFFARIRHRYYRHTDNGLLIFKVYEIKVSKTKNISVLRNTLIRTNINVVLNVLSDINAYNLLFQKIIIF